MNNDIIACFPQWGSYSCAFRYLFENGFDVKYMTPPPLTKKTIEIGSKYSPDYVCVPFKYCLGCHIEALENGANCLMQIFGSCRLNYYGELEEKILRDLGYEFKFFNMAEINFRSPRSIMENFKIVNPKVSLIKIIKALPTTINIIKTIDKMEDYIRKNAGFEVNKNELEDVFCEFKEKLNQTKNSKEYGKLKKEYTKKLRNIKINKPHHPLRVGLVGDYYTVQEPFSNYYIEQELEKMGIEVHREMNLTNTIINSKYKNSCKTGKRYVKFDIGATANYTVAEALKYARNGLDGIIQVKSFGCTPELNAQTVLQNIGRDYKVPILHFSFDSQTSETGIKTRLEAFYDMLEAKKK